jgi:hypothetical protein
MGNICTREPFVPGNHVHLGTICTWEPFVSGNHLYLGTICVWEPFVPGSLLCVKNLWVQERYCQDPFLQEFYFQERFGGNVLVGTFWQELCGRSPGKIILKMILDQIKIIFSKTILNQIKIILFQRNDLDLRSRS